MDRATLASEGLLLATRHPEVEARPAHLVDATTERFYHGSIEFLKGQPAVVVGDCACSTCSKLDLMDPNRKVALAIDDDGHPQLAFHARSTSVLTQEEFWNRCMPTLTPASTPETPSPTSRAAARR